MAATISSDQLLLGLRESGIVEQASLDSFLESWEKEALDQGADDLAEALLKNGLITRFQKDMLLQGKRRGYIIADKYILLDHLGAGGMGSVYLCQHKIMQRRVAIKVLPTAFAKDPEYLQRFHREARAAAALDHPNIVRAFDVDHDEKIHFLVMEYVDGCSLHDMVSRDGPLDCRRAADYIMQSAAGLQHAHEAGLVHRDIKPGNLLVDRKGTVKVLDMGLALFFQEQGKSLTQQYDANAVLGTAEYLAPEQAVDSHGVDIRADIYSLGLTLFFLLTGKSPYGEEGTLAQKLLWHQMRTAKSVREFRPDVPEGLADVITKMLAKDRAERYQTPAEVVEALTPWAKGESPAPRTLTKSGPVRKTSVTETVVDADTKAPTRTKKRISDSSGVRSKKKTEKIDVLEEITDDDDVKSKGPRSSGKHRKTKKKSVWAQPGVIAACAGGGVLVIVGIIILIVARGGSNEPVSPLPPANNVAQAPNNTVDANPPPVKVEPPQIIEIKPVQPEAKKPEPPKNDKREPPKKADNPPPEKPKKNPPKKVEPPPPPAKESLADYFPKAGGVPYFYDFATYIPGEKLGRAVRQRWEFKDPKDVKDVKMPKELKDATVIDITIVRTGPIEGSLLKGVAVPWAQVSQRFGQAFLRTTGSHTELGVPQSKSIYWEPILPLQAGDNETWKMPLADGDFKQYQVTKIDRKKQSITVRSWLPPLPEGQAVRISTYEKGKGEVSRVDSIEKGSKSKVVLEMKIVE